MGETDPPPPPPPEPQPAPPRRLIQIARSDYESWQGALESRVAAFEAELAAHALTIGVPAPVEGPLVEMIARNGGMANVVISDDADPPAAVTVPAAVTRWQARAELLASPSLAGRASRFDDVDAALRAAVAAATAAGDDAALTAARIALDAWEAAGTITRAGALAQAMAAVPGFDAVALDALFVAAALREA